MAEQVGHLWLGLLQQLKMDLERMQNDYPSQQALDLVHVASKARILMLAEKFARRVGLVDYAERRPSEVEIPSQDEWEFQMGDRVKVKYGLQDFKSLSQRTVGWNSKYVNILSHVGVVTSVCSKHDCHIQIFFPDLSLMAEIFAGVLEKTEEVPNIFIPSRFEVGDRVVINSPKEIVQLLQRDFGRNDPVSFLGRTGKVVAVGQRGVHVTFTGNFTCEINPAILQRSNGELHVGEFSNAKGIKPDDKVRVKKNLKKLIEAQKIIHEWESWMSKLPWKILRVLLVKENGLLRVCSKAGRSFHIHTDSVLLIDEPQEQEDDDDVPFPIDEWVIIKRDTNVTSIFKSETIPVSFLEFIRYPASISSYKNSDDPGITFDFQYTITVPRLALEPHNNDDEEKGAKEMDVRRKDWKAGDEVYLNLGPPGYVRDVLTETNMASEIVEAMTSVAHICGFSDSRHAVIRCSDGVLRRVNTVNLTVPQKFLSSRNEELHRQHKQAKEITGIVEGYMKGKIESSSAEEDGIQSISLVQDKEGLPTLRFTIRSSKIKLEEMMRSLRKAGVLEFELVKNTLIKVLTINSKQAEVEMLVEFVEAKRRSEERNFADLFAAAKQKTLEEPDVTVQEAAATSVKARPGPVVELIDDAQPERGPREAGLEGYRHMELNLNGTRVLVPYKFASDQQQRVEQPAEDRERPQVETSQIGRITIEGNITGVSIQ